MQTAQTELDFINLYLEKLSTKSVRYGEDYLARTLPNPLRIKRTPTTSNVQNKTPASTTQNTTTSNTDSSKFQIIVKVLKPSKQFTIGGLTPDVTVGQLKKRIYQQQSSFPANRQRLLVKGKVLAEQKTLQEISVSEGSIVHLMLTAAPASTSSETITDDAAAIANMGTNITSSSTTSSATCTGGVSTETQQKLASSEFWSAIEKAIVEQVGPNDAPYILSKMKTSLSS